MVNSSYAQVDFTGGEFSPFVDARVDANRYKTALSRCLNIQPIPSGPANRRPGSRFVHRTKDNGVARLIPFKFSQTQTYQIEFGNLYCRFYRNNGLILESAKVITAVTRGSTTVLTSASHGYSNGNRVYITGLVGDGLGAIPLSILNNREYVVANVTTNTFEIQVPPSTAINSSTYDAYSSGGSSGRIYEIATTYATADLFLIDYEQSLDTLFLGVAGTTYPRRKLTRTGDTAWTLSTIADEDGPYTPINSTTTTLTPSGVGPGSVTVTASAITGINSDTGFQTTDVGRQLRLEGSDLNWVHATITGRSSTTSITVNLDTALPNTTAITSWRLGLWSATSGYPGSPKFFEDRLCWGGAPADPQRVDGSRSGNYGNYKPTDDDGTVGDDHAISFTFNSGDVNAILSLASMEGAMFAFTPAGEWIMQSAYEKEPVTPTSVYVDRFARWGAYHAQAATIQNTTLFLHRGKRRLREVQHERGGSATVSDLSELAYHLCSGGLEEMAYQQEPHQNVWLRKTDGGFLGVTYKRESESFFAGWQEHRLGGGEIVTTLTYGGDTYSLYGAVESISCIPSVTTNRDELWLIVKRVINGVTVRHIEYLDAPFDPEMTYANANHLDCSQKVTSGSNITSISGLFYFEGQTLNTWINGVVGPDVVVANGKFAISNGLAARTVIFGYKYTSQGTLLRPEAGSADGGPALGKLRRVHKTTINLWRTMGLEMAIDATGQWDNLALTGANGFTGLKQITLSSDIDMEGKISWRQTGPEPGMIRSITGFIKTEDGV